MTIDRDDVRSLCFDGCAYRRCPCGTILSLDLDGVERFDVAMGAARKQAAEIKQANPRFQRETLAVPFRCPLARGVVFVRPTASMPKCPWGQLAGPPPILYFTP